MLEHNVGPERARFRFVGEALSNFDFLLTNFGFKCVTQELTFVRLESATVFVNLFHGRGSHELGFEVGLHTRATSLKHEEAFSLYEIIVLNNAQKETQYSFYWAGTPELVKERMPMLADLVRRYAMPAIAGDQTIFEKLGALRHEASRKLERDSELRWVRPKAEEAWHAKDFKKVVELYQSVVQYLTPAELKKLDYAKKHLE